MNGYYDEHPEKLPAPRRDVEVTLGPLLQLVALVILIVIVASAFGLGYSMGERSSGKAAAEPALAATPASGSGIKPSATAPAGTQATHAATPAAVDDSSNDDPAAPVQNLGPQVKPALAEPTAESGAVPAGQPHAALAPSALMVQIAAVSHQEDADVLLSALRRRGYAVSSRRDPADGLIHVRLGPFPTRAEAETMKNKLLGDGYNAQLQ